MGNKSDNVHHSLPDGCHFVQYAEQLKHLREAASEDIEVAKRRDGLEGIQIDVGSITPKFA